MCGKAGGYPGRDVVERRRRGRSAVSFSRRRDVRASRLWFSARSTGKMKIPANASVHYVAATRKRDTRHCGGGVTQEIVPLALEISETYSRNGVFMNLFMGSFFPGEVCRGIPISATRSPRDATYVCRNVSAIIFFRANYERINWSIDIENIQWNIMIDI